MTELEVIDGDKPSGSLTDVVAQRLRGQLAERRIKQTQVIARTGWSKTTAYRKTNGYSPIDTDEFQMLWQQFGISPVFLLTGKVDDQPGPGPDGGGVRPKGFEPPTFWDGAEATVTWLYPAENTVEDEDAA